MAKPNDIHVFREACQKLRESLGQGTPLSKLDYRILRSTIFLLLVDLDRHVNDGRLHTESGSDAWVRQKQAPGHSRQDAAQSHRGQESSHEAQQQ
jgi:hypothetical protein